MRPHTVTDCNLALSRARSPSRRSARPLVRDWHEPHDVQIGHLCVRERAYHEPRMAVSTRWKLLPVLPAAWFNGADRSRLRRRA
jgi:hypothetical protein